MNRPLLGAYGIAYEYDGKRVVDSVSFELERGEILALLGPNGSGKSTLLKAVAGVLPLREGVVRFKGEDFKGFTSAERASHLAYVPPDLRAEFPLTAWEAVLLGTTCKGARPSKTAEEEVHRSMQLCLCWHLRNQDLHTLSGGERQLVALARAIAQGAKILFLDEALSRMDLNHQGEIGRVLKRLTREDYAMVLVAHDLNLASEWASSVLLLRGGKQIAAGPIRETLTEANLRALYPGSELLVSASPATGAPKVFFGAESPDQK